MLEGFIEEGVPVPVFWVFVGAAIVIQGISKSGFAGGAGILSLPLMMLVMPVNKVTACLLPLLILCDMNAIYHHRRNVDWKVVLRIYLPAIVGILAGAWVWWKVGRAGVAAYAVPIKRFVGVIAVLFAVYLVAKEAAMAWIDRIKPGPKSAVVAGVTAGFTSTIAHAAGPIVSLYIFAQGLGKTLFVGTVAWTFTLINLTKLPFYIGVGLIRPDVLLVDLCLIWLIPIGSGLGKWMHHRVSEKLFNRVILVLTLIAGLQLVSNVNLILLGLNFVLGRS
ncbi:MAG: sulfite exporter TauE/SafE family protein [Candidatus Hydrogenedentes bacterium]|nr:sulfite exporter TauE/SafE family protein [Candidatus Hydrogenedentota bacterium]